MTHWTFVTDTFFVRSRGEIVCLAPMHGLKIQPGWVIQLFGPNEQVITTTISGCDMGKNNFGFPSVYGVHIKGFDEKVNFDGWLAAVHAD